MMSLNMESLFLVLSGVILAAGVLYWFWSHIQLTQKKVQLLENAVFELRGMLRPEAASPGSPGPPSSSSGPAPAVESSAPAYEDLPDDDNWSESPGPAPTDAPQLQVSEDLQPGGRAAPLDDRAFPPSPPKEAPAAAEFRELFVSSAPVEEPKHSSESLEAMPVKELRRLADQRGIQGTADMKKKEILAALRQQIVPAPVVKEEEEVKTLDIALEEVPVLE